MGTYVAKVYITEFVICECREGSPVCHACIDPWVLITLNTSSYSGDPPISSLHSSTPGAGVYSVTCGDSIAG